MNFDFLTDDWKKIPPSNKYFFGLGVFFMFTTWLVDHWGSIEVYKLFGLDFRRSFFSIGLLIIILAFIPLIWAQFIFWKRSRQYRSKYPIKDLNKKFNLVWFNGKLFLFDNSEKKYYHVYPWETAQDLFFVNTGTKVDFNIEEAENILLEQGNSIKLSDYKNGGVINTRLK